MSGKKFFDWAMGWLKQPAQAELAWLSTDDEIADAIRSVPAHFSATQMPDLKTACLRQLSIPPGNIMAAPTTAPTHSATGGGSSGGSLAAGTYYLKYTWVSTSGIESPASAESAILTVSSGNIPRVTFPTRPIGVASINLYATAANGAVNTEVLYATGIVSTTYDMSAAAPASTAIVAVPGASAGTPTVTATGGGATGGGLQQGTYYFKVTQTTSAGVESSPSAEVGPVVVSAGNIPRVTFPALGSGFTSFSIYLTNGQSGTEQKYVSGITASYYDCSANALATGSAPPPVAPTTTPTVNVTGGGATGGTLGAGAYYLMYTFVGVNGLESSPSPESAVFTVGATNIPTVTMQALPAGVVSIKVYLTAAAGASGSEKLYASGITSTTYNLATDVNTHQPAAPASGAAYGNPVDMILCDGSVAMLVDVGSCLGAPTSIVVAMQESDDLVTWTAVYDNAATVGLLVNVGLFGTCETVNEWKRSKRYLRAGVTITGGTNPVVPMSVSFISRRKITGPLPNPPIGYSPAPNPA